MRKKLLCVVLLTLLSGCAMPLTASEMAPLTDIYTQIPDNPRLERKIALGSVTLDKEAELMGTPPLPGYRDALQNALLTSNLLARTQDPQFVLDARLNSFDLPIIGFNLDCYANATYTLRNKQSGEVVVLDTVKSHYEAKFGEAFDGALRMRICITGALRENITHYLRLLSQKSNADLK